MDRLIKAIGSIGVLFTFPPRGWVQKLIVSAILAGPSFYFLPKILAACLASLFSDSPICKGIPGGLISSAVGASAILPCCWILFYYFEKRRSIVPVDRADPTLPRKAREFSAENVKAFFDLRNWSASTISIAFYFAFFNFSYYSATSELAEAGSIFVSRHDYIAGAVLLAATLPFLLLHFIWVSKVSHKGLRILVTLATACLYMTIGAFL